MKINVTNETKTGLLVVVCLVALAVLVIQVGNFTVFQKGYLVKSRFHFTAGVKKHAPVRLSGVDVGEVKDIQMIYGDETLVELELWFREDVKLRQDSKAYVTTLGLMGEKYVEIKAGTSAAEYAREGDLIPGVDPVRLEELIEIGTKVAGDIGQMAKDISRATNHIDEVVTSNRGKIGNIFDNLEETSVNFKEFSEDIKYHPWKILAKGKEKTREEIEKDRLQRRRPQAEAEVPAAADRAPEIKKQNFSSSKK